MRLRLATQGRLAEFMAAEATAIDRGVHKAVSRSTNKLKLAARAEINARYRGSGVVRGGNRRVANAIRGVVFQDGPATSTGLVFSKFGRRDIDGSFIDYLAPFVHGAIIRPGASKWLYIPLQRGRRARGSRLSESRAKNLVFIPLSGGRALLVRRTRNRSTPIALLVKRVTIRARLDFRREVARARQNLGKFLLEELDKP